MTHSTSTPTLLREGLSYYGMAAYYEPMLAYLTLLEKWNHAFNLTAIRDAESMVTRHIMDSLAVANDLKPTRVIDVGTGAGLPGLPLAITHPQLQFVLLDSNGKKTRFLEEVVRTLHLNNVEIVQKRVETYQPTTAFDTVISRAFTDLAQMVNWTKHLIADQGIWLAMKGRVPETELSMIKEPYTVRHYSVPGVDGERCAITLTHAN